MIFPVALALLLASHFARATGPQPHLQAATDFQAEGRLSATRQLVILVAVTREGCPYCALLKREILAPMLRSGEYEDKTLLREMVIDPEYLLIDFDGQSTSSTRLAEKYSVELTPTVLLLDHAGRSLHPPMTGISNVEMYGYYLDRAIENSLASLNGDQSTQQPQE